MRACVRGRVGGREGGWLGAAVNCPPVGRMAISRYVYVCVCVCVRVCKKLSSHWEDVDIHLMRRLVTISLYYINLT